jgi:hypothetical protein
MVRVVGASVGVGGSVVDVVGKDAGVVGAVMDVGSMEVGAAGAVVEVAGKLVVLGAVVVDWVEVHWVRNTRATAPMNNNVIERILILITFRNIIDLFVLILQYKGESGTYLQSRGHSRLPRHREFRSPNNLEVLRK